MEEGPNKGPKTFEDALSYLSPRQKKFVELYLKQPDGKKAKDGAGYPPSISVREILRGAHVAAAIRLGFAVALSSEEIRSRIEDIGTVTLEDFITYEKVTLTRSKVYDVRDAIDLLMDLIEEQQEEFNEARPKKKKEVKRELRRLERLVKCCNRRLQDIENAVTRGDKKIPGTDIRLDIEKYQETQMFVDLERAKELGKMHLIKGLKYDKEGRLLVELHSATWALEFLGKHAGLLDKEESGDVNIHITRKIVGGGAK